MPRIRWHTHSSLTYISILGSHLVVQSRSQSFTIGLSVCAALQLSLGPYLIQNKDTRNNKHGINNMNNIEH